ncbi:7040_t:CDS:1, partial [Cetraspora pellucida]
MTSRSNITLYTCQKEFPNTFNILNNTLVCTYCEHSVSWKQKVSITTHVNSKTHLKNKKNYEIAAQHRQSQTLEDSIS